MTPEQFCYWLKGFSDAPQDAPPTQEQWKMIKDNLQSVQEFQMPTWFPKSPHSC